MTYPPTVFNSIFCTEDEGRGVIVSGDLGTVNSSSTLGQAKKSPTLGHGTIRGPNPELYVAASSDEEI